MIVLINARQPDVPPEATPTDIVAAVPVIDWKAESAALTSPLQEELKKLQSDLKKAEEKVREDIGL